MTGAEKVVEACKAAARQCIADESADPTLSTRLLIALGSFGYRSSWQTLQLSADWVDNVAIANTPEGYDARAVYHRPSRSLVLINRGSEGLLSQRDWVEGLQAAQGAIVQPLRDCVSFVGNALANAATQNLAVDELVACGHSWGGALSECQVALGRASAGFPPIWGVGFASPGFSAAIRALGAQLGQPVDDGRVAGEITHYARKWDLVPGIGSGRIGQTVKVGSIYLERKRDTGPHAQPRPPVAPSAEAHNCWLYFGYYHVPEDHHVYIRLNGAVSVAPGRAP